MCIANLEIETFTKEGFVAGDSCDIPSSNRERTEDESALLLCERVTG